MWKLPKHSWENKYLLNDNISYVIMSTSSTALLYNIRRVSRCYTPSTRKQVEGQVAFLPLGRTSVCLSFNKERKSSAMGTAYLFDSLLASVSKGYYISRFTIYMSELIVILSKQILFSLSESKSTKPFECKYNTH